MGRGARGGAGFCGWFGRLRPDEPAEGEAERGTEGEAPEGEGEVGDDDGGAGGGLHGICLCWVKTKAFK